MLGDGWSGGREVEADIRLGWIRNSTLPRVERHLDLVAGRERDIAVGFPENLKVRVLGIGNRFPGIARDNCVNLDTRLAIDRAVAAYVGNPDDLGRVDPVRVPDARVGAYHCVVIGAVTARDLQQPFTGFHRVVLVGAARDIGIPTGVGCA